MASDRFPTIGGTMDGPCDTGEPDRPQGAMTYRRHREINRGIGAPPTVAELEEYELLRAEAAPSLRRIAPMVTQALLRQSCNRQRGRVVRVQPRRRASRARRSVRTSRGSPAREDDSEPADVARPGGCFRVPEEGRR
jgi:hypothetical protein